METTQPARKDVKSENNYNVNCSRPYEAGQSLTHKPNRTAQNMGHFTKHNHMETTYQINSRKNTENKETNALANKPKIQIKHRK